MRQTIPAQPDDDSFLFQLYASTRADELRSWGWDDATQHTFLTMQWMAQQRSYAAQYPNAEHRIIYFQNLRAGRIFVSREDQRLVLVDLSLLPEFQKQGIGTALLQDLQDEAADCRLPLQLSVLKTNPAKRLYERLGFTTIGDNGMYDFMEWCTATS